MLRSLPLRYYEEWPGEVRSLRWGIGGSRIFGAPSLRADGSPLEAPVAQAGRQDDIEVEVQPSRGAESSVQQTVQ